MKRLENTVRKLENQGLLEQYDAIIKEQLVKGIVEPAEKQFVGREFYMPHKPVNRESAERTKLRIVYDASARAYDKVPSRSMIALTQVHPFKINCGQCWCEQDLTRFLQQST